MKYVLGMTLLLVLPGHSDGGDAAPQPESAQGLSIRVFGKDFRFPDTCRLVLGKNLDASALEIECLPEKDPKGLVDALLTRRTHPECNPDGQLPHYVTRRTIFRDDVADGLRRVEDELQFQYSKTGIYQRFVIGPVYCLKVVSPERKGLERITSPIWQPAIRSPDGKAEET